jgi:phosphoglycolate phosphatase
MSLPPRQFDLIVFDWDGTLFDSTALIIECIQAASQDLGMPIPTREQASYVIGLGLSEALKHAVPDLPPHRYAALSERYQHHYFKKQLEVHLFDGTLELLKALKLRHFWVAVATGKSRRGLNEALHAVELQGLFNSSRTADETASKPHPQMLLELMREFGTDPHRTLMIGDTTHDLQMAHNAGTPSVGVSFGAHPHEAFTPWQPRFVAHSTSELHHWLIENA